MRASGLPFLKLLIALLAALMAFPVAAQNHIAAELAAEGGAQPGEPLELAIHFTPQPGWHGYWSNPGDAGYGMRLQWNLPPGWEAGGSWEPGASGVGADVVGVQHVGGEAAGVGEPVECVASGWCPESSCAVVDVLDD